MSDRFFFSLLIILFSLSLSSELSLVFQSDIAYFNAGDDVVLSCHLEPAISATSMEIMWWNKEDLVFHCKDGQMIESYEGRVSLSLQDVMWLTLRDVRRSQKGLCICEVIYDCQTLQDTIFISFSCKYSNKHVSNMNGQEKTIDNYDEHWLSLSIQELERGTLSLTSRNDQQSDRKIHM